MLKKFKLLVILFSVLLISCSEEKQDISEIKICKFKQNPNLIEEKRELKELAFTVGIPKTFTELDSALFEKYSPAILDLVADTKLKIEPHQIYYSDSLSTLLFLSRVFFTGFFR
jgi:hypothetical protein